MKKYELLLCDADGTILDFQAAEHKALLSACESLDIPLSPQEAALYTEINESLWRALERGEVTQDALRTLRFVRFFEAIGAKADAGAMAEAFVAALSLQTDEMPGAEAFLREASRRVPVIIVTNGIASVQRSRFALSPLSVYLSGHVISSEVGAAKPDPRMIDAALRLAKVPGEKALMLGDEPTSDIAAACAAGIDSCWYNPTARPNETPHQPTYAVQSLDEVLQWL